MLEEDDNMVLDNGTPNTGLQKTCDALFYGNGDLAGNIGVKNLGYIVSAPEQEFQSYLDGMTLLTTQDEDLSQ